MSSRFRKFVFLLYLAASCFTPEVRSAPAIIYRDTIQLKYWDYESRLVRFLPHEKYYPYHRLQSFPPSGSSRDYSTVELENDFIKVTVLPWNGGHILRFINKTTGSNQYYLNPEGFKVTRGGRLEWWLVPGGTEWMIPYDEHGSTFYQPFDDYTGPGAEPDGIRIEDFDGGVRLTMVYDEASWFAEQGIQFTRWRTDIQVEVPDNEALYREHIHVVNDSAVTQPLMFWENTQLCPGPGNMIITPGSERNLNLQLVHPRNVYQQYDHNAMEPWLAGKVPWGRFSWPRHSNTTNTYEQLYAPNPAVIKAANVNLSLLANWYEEGLNGAGTFVPRGFRSTFAGVYNLDADEGVAKTFPEVIVTNPSPVETGCKLWHFGVFGAAASYGFSNGTNVFVELMSGPCRVFEEPDVFPHPTGEADRIFVSGGGELSWSNAFSSPHEIGGLVYADERVVLNLEVSPTARPGKPMDLEIGVYTTAFQNGAQISVDIGGRTIYSQTGVSTSPGFSPGPFHLAESIVLPNDTPVGPTTATLSYRFPDTTLASCSQPITVAGYDVLSESFESMPEWSDFLITTTGQPSNWSISSNGYVGNCLAAAGAVEGVDNRILLYPVSPNERILIRLRMRCPSWTGLNYWARAAYRFASERDEICGPGLADPGGGWQNVVEFRRGSIDGNGNTWQEYSLLAQAGPNDRYVGIGFELGGQGTPRPNVGWDEVSIRLGNTGNLWTIY